MWSVVAAIVDSASSRDSVLAAKARVPRHAVYRAFVNETVVLNLETGRYHGLNPTAGRMLEVLDGASSVAAAAEGLAQEYGRSLEEIQQDLYEFCIDLRARGLLEIVTDADSSA
jgi:Coenzyme PQQ synthesis protein D (PqqD)